MNNRKLFFAFMLRTGNIFSCICIKLVLQRKVSLGQWLKDWKRTDFFMEYDKQDPKPFWQYIKDKII